MKKLRTLAALAAAALLAFALCLSGCTGNVYVTDIRPLGDGTYVVEYSDGSTSSFVLKDGEDGEDGKDGADGADGQDGQDGQDGEDGKDGQDGQDGASVTVEDLYEQYCEQYGDMTYEQFLEKFLGQSDTLESAVGYTLLSTVGVFAEFYETQELTDGTEDTHTQVYFAAGVIYKIDEDYTYILTNEHVFISDYVNEDNGSDLPRRTVCYPYGSAAAPQVVEEDGEPVLVDGVYEVYEYGEGTLDAEYVGGSVTQDVALMRVSTEELLAINPDVHAVTFADEYYVGQSAFTVGAPNGEGMSVTRGIVSVESEYIDLRIGGEMRSHRELRMDVPIYGGNSGGGLFNGKGELIGLSNARRTSDQNITFAVPLPVVEGVAANVYAYATDGDAATVGARKPYLGITVRRENDRYVYDAAVGHGHTVSEIYADSFEEGSIAAGLGLQEEDRLLSVTIGGRTFALDHLYSLGDALLWARPGDEITFRYLRGGAEGQTAPYTFAASDFIVVE